MTRDMDLIREILLRLEGMRIEGEYNAVRVHDPVFAGLEADPEAIGYQLKLLINHGLIASRSKNHPAAGFIFEGLTWAGHDFLDAVRSDDIWKRTKAAAQKVGGWSVDALVETAKAIVKQELGKLISGG